MDSGSDSEGATHCSIRRAERHAKSKRHFIPKLLDPHAHLHPYAQTILIPTGFRAARGSGNEVY